MGTRRNWPGEIKLVLWPVYRLLRRLQLGASLYKELEFSAYTCLTKAGAELRHCEGRVNSR